ncbi:cytokine-dependent hematopoietic cell linker [Peromyscus californicus insignis]|uniref:cytokine-dependent hematopoietic cell linker n=1 Tax=Peromyscus californicus insignis TaxID=564181 RepID=UPI0022A7B7E1|nr:cytokine-dependent hematopoietic cell linker [Peromyscus californicus insignis]
MDIEVPAMPRLAPPESTIQNWLLPGSSDSNGGNKRTTKEGFGDLRFQNFSLPKNRSWPHLSSTKGRCRAVLEPLPDHRRNLAAVLDGGKCHSDDDYEDPELQLLKAWPSMKILPARPIQESEYADTRYFKDMMEAPLLLPPKASVPIGKQIWNIGMRRQEEVFYRDKPISKDVRSQHFKGFKYTEVNKIPVPPPRQISSKDFGKLFTIIFFNSMQVLGAEEGSYHQTKPGPSCPSQNQNTQKSPPDIASSSYMPAKHTVHVRDHTGIMQHRPQRCQAAASPSPHDRVLPYENTNTEKPVPTKPDEKDVQQNEWYIGEYSRQAVEEVLRRENKDGTFLVRDCSTKSKAEPYVLMVFHRNKVYNVKIRFLESNQQYALGTGLRGNEMFDSVEDIIEHYKYFPIILIDGKDKAGVHREQCYLTQPLPFSRRFLTQYSSQALHE